MKDTRVCLSGILAVTEDHRQLKASLVDLRLYPQADDSEGLVKDCSIVVAVVNAGVS